MSKTIESAKLQNGTIVRHKTVDYSGRIDGITEIQSCFTAGGASLKMPGGRQSFQYRVAVAGESIRRIAPAEDLEILEAVADVACPRCHYSFQTKPGLVNKPTGRCQCGGWICPACLACQGGQEEKAKGSTACLKQRQRQGRKLVARRKSRGD